MVFSRLCTLFLFGLCGVFVADTDVMKSVSVMEGDSVTLNTNVTEVLRDDVILWMFQETQIAEIHGQNISMDESYETFGDRLQMDSQTGSLTIRNIRIEHSGLYKIQIFNNRGTAYEQFIVTVYGESGRVLQTVEKKRIFSILLIIIYMLLLLLMSAYMLYCCCRKCNPEKTEDEKSLSEYTQIIYRLQI